MAQLLFSNFLGLAPAASTRTNLQFGEEYHVADATSINMLDNQGLLAPGFAPSTDLDTANNVSGKIASFFSTDANGSEEMIFIEDGAKLHRADANDGQADVGYTSYPITVNSGFSGTTLVDLAPLLINSGSTAEVLVTFYDSSFSGLGRVRIGSTSLGTFTSHDVESVTTNRVPMPIVLAENGLVYWAQKNNIHKYEIDVAATSAVIDLPTGWVIYDLLDYRGYLWILALYSPGVAQGVTLSTLTGWTIGRRAAVFVWNYQSRKSSEFSGFERGTPYNLGLMSKLGNIFLHDGLPHVMALTAEGRTQIKRFTGSEFATVMDEPGNYLPFRRNIRSKLNTILWLSADDGTLCSFGRTSRSMPEMFNKIGSTGAASGGIILSKTGKIWASYGTDNLRIMDGIPATSSVTTLTRKLPKMSRVTRITVFFPPNSDTTASNTLTLTAYKNFSTTAISGTYQASHAADLARGYWTFSVSGEGWNNVSALRFKLDWANTGVTTTFQPYMIQVDYERTSKVI